MRELLMKLKDFLKGHGYVLTVESDQWVLSREGNRIHYDSLRDIMNLIWKLYNEELAGMDFNILSDPARFDKRFPGVINSNEVRSQLLESYLDCASFYMLTSTDDRLLRFCMTDHYQIRFQTSAGMEEAWGFHKFYMRALEDYSCIEHGLEAVRFRINWFAGASEPGEEWENWFQEHKTISYRDDNGLLHTSEVWAPRIGARSIDAREYLEELKANGRVEIDLSNFYDNFKDGMKFLNCKMIIYKF